MPGLLPVLPGGVSGQPDEGVIKAAAPCLQLGHLDSHRRERTDQRCGQIPRAGDRHIAVLSLHHPHAVDGVQRLVVHGLRGGKAHPVPACLGGDRFRGVQRPQAPPVDERHAVAQGFGLIHEVGDEDHGDATLPHALDERPGLPPGLGIEPGGQLVQDGDLGVPHQRERDGQPLFLAAGQVLERGTLDVRDPQGLEHLPRVQRIRVEGGNQLQGLARLQPGRQRALLELDAHELFDLVPVALRGQPVHADGS
jgi:hypothetical protein